MTLQVILDIQRQTLDIGHWQMVSFFGSGIQQLVTCKCTQGPTDFKCVQREFHNHKLHDVQDGDDDVHDAHDGNHDDHDDHDEDSVHDVHGSDEVHGGN